MGQREEVARMRSLVNRHRIAVEDGDSGTAARLEAEMRSLVGIEVGPAVKTGFYSAYARKVRKRGN